MARFNVAVVGCGSVSRSWLKPLRARDDVEFVGLADLDRERAERMAVDYDLRCPVFPNVESAVKGGGANLVVNLTSPAAHHSVVGAALELGCDVLGEKPMAVSLREARELVEIAERSGRTYGVMQNYRFDAGARALRAGLAAGRIGVPSLFCADFFIAPHFGGFRETMASPLLLDMSIHQFDQARFFAGSDPVAVSSLEFNLEGSWFEGNASAVCTFEFADGSVFSYRGSWSAQGAPTSWNAHWRVVGEHGTAVWDGVEAPWAETGVRPAEPDVLWPTEREIWPADLPGRSGHEACLYEMLDALAAGRKPETDASDNIHSLEMTLACLESAAQRRRVRISELE